MFSTSIGSSYERGFSHSGLLMRPVHIVLEGLTDDDDEIAYFTVRWKTRKLVLSTAPKTWSNTDRDSKTENGPISYWNLSYNWSVLVVVLSEYL